MGTRLAKAIISAKSAGLGINVSWEAVEGADLYALYGKTPDDKWELLTRTTDLSVNFESVEYGIKYYYKVRAYNSETKMYGETSDVAEGMNLSKVKVSTSSKRYGINVTWTYSKGATSYEVYRKTDGESWEMIEEYARFCDYQDKKVKEGIVYTYKVKACNFSCNSVSEDSECVSRGIGVRLPKKGSGIR